MPMLVDLGKGTCIPCKKMKPILDELKTEYEGKAVVRIIDLRDEPKEASRYGIRLIPTQIFFDAEGKEVFRHEGFMDKQSIKAKFAEMGVY
ncbi:MAG: thioredoxin domain-containing protein [Candidatus Zixiibacteriota bacterium]